MILIPLVTLTEWSGSTLITGRKSSSDLLSSSCCLWRNLAALSSSVSCLGEVVLRGIWPGTPPLEGTEVVDDLGVWPGFSTEMTLSVSWKQNRKSVKYQICYVHVYVTKKKEILLSEKHMYPICRPLIYNIKNKISLFKCKAIIARKWFLLMPWNIMVRTSYFNMTMMEILWTRSNMQICIALSD